MRSALYECRRSVIDQKHAIERNTMPNKTSANGKEASSDVNALVREAAAVRGIRSGPHTESRVDLLSLQFTQKVHQLAEGLRERAVEEAEQQFQATTRRMLDNAKTEAEEIVQAATQRAQQKEQMAEAAAQHMLDNAKTKAEEIVDAATRRANDLDTKGEATTRDLAGRINEQYTSFMGAIEDILSKPEGSGKGSEDDPETPMGNPLRA